MSKIDNKIIEFFKYIKTNGNIEKLGTNSDNKNEAIHRWFSFMPGFSHIFVKTAIEHFNLGKQANHYKVFDPFMGSATTAIAGRSLGVKVVGNESNLFLYQIGKAKAHMISDPELLDGVKKDILKKASLNWRKSKLSKENPLLRKCYTRSNLQKLIALRDIYLSDSIPRNFKPYLFVAISSLLPRCSNVGISIPYVSWKNTHIPQEPFKLFSKILEDIKTDLIITNKIPNNEKTDIFLHDSRVQNNNINNKSIDLVFTSPPYLNNLDYGEALKVYTYFWKITKDWQEITEKIRKKSLTSATTHYRDKDYISKFPEAILGREMVSCMPYFTKEITEKFDLIKKARSKKKREKSFEILTALYFRDMFYVLKEAYRVLKDDGLCFMIIGDSAPYGVYVPTDEFLGKIAINIGFSKYSLETLRPRGLKWLNLTYRHKVRLRESLLVLRK